MKLGRFCVFDGRASNTCYNRAMIDQPQKKTILIFGVDTFAGSSIAQFFKKHFRVIGTYHDEKTSISGILTIPCDVLVKEEVQLLIYAFKVDICIYAVGMESIYECDQNPQRAEAINTSGLFNVAEFCQRYKAQVCYLSSQYVFSGNQVNYIEMDIPDPNTVYGRTKSSSEFYLQKTSLNYIIFRCCHLYGRGQSVLKQTWFEKIQKNFLKSENVTADAALKMGFLDVDYLSMLMKVCFEKNVMNRLFQICSKDIDSHYDFAKKYSQIFKENTKLIKAGLWPFKLEKGNKNSQLQSYQLDPVNIEGFLNITMPTVEESIQYTYEKFNGSVDQKSSWSKSKSAGISFI
ncbi:MAG: sugar nucleotide-binding protein [Bacteriovoracaceae bacterium]|nr:sugar nucleotide-binding protein [Bacteriovoracaceae bacterium]